MRRREADPHPCPLPSDGRGSGGITSRSTITRRREADPHPLPSPIGWAREGKDYEEEHEYE